ncbi:hypothetical protein EBU71_16065 [bacterium]|nr:hypothetical protein [Candidatus Elulimicrobium humile]
MYDKPVVSCSVYTGWKELLELRLTYLHDRFNEIIIAEADYTLSGNPKEFTLERDLTDLGLLKDNIKIVQIRQKDLPNKGRTSEERHDYLFDCMRKHIPENSIVFVTYEDEIPHYLTVDYYRSVSYASPVHNVRLPLAHLSGHCAWQFQSASGELVQNRQGYVCRSEHFDTYSLSDFRREKTRDGKWTWVDFPGIYLQDNNTVQDAGWKFQCMGSHEDKWKMYADSNFYSEHSALGRQLRKEYMQRFVPIDHGQDPLAVRDHHITPYDTGKLPEIINYNPKLKEFFLPILEGNHEPLIFSYPQMNGITMCTNKKPRMWIVEDFYDDPDSVREFALNQTYYDDPGFIGKRTRQQFFFPGMKERFEQIMGMRITNWESHGMNGRFQHNVAGESLTWHTDFQKYAGLIYLTPNAPYSAGTRMAAFKANRVRHCSDPRIMDCFNQISFLDGTEYEDVDVVGNVYNRLVIYDGGLIHAAKEYFGYNKDNCRLWHMFFFDTE